MSDFKHNIEGALRQLDFVEWDRFVEGVWEEGLKYVSVYGWIDREDEYKDFVEVTFWDDGGRWFTTSSDEYTYRIHEILFDEPPEEHNACKRVEDHFDLRNQIEL
jgi:hypothetical protein